MVMNYDPVIVSQFSQETSEASKLRQALCNAIGNGPDWFVLKPLSPVWRYASAIEQGHVLVHPLQLKVVGEGQSLRSPEPPVGLLKDC